MKKTLFAWFSLLSLCLLLAACGGRGGETTSSRAERSKPRVAVDSMNVMLRRAPAANATIGPDGSLRIDDIELPLPPAQRTELQQLFMHLQMQRQRTLETAAPDPNMRSVGFAPTPEITAAQAAVLRDIPSLQPYRDSFGNLQAERR
ncbi:MULTISPECIES: hypothetical protein [unclassified Xanthomonas]|uniref:hypothetical protein n=1 Tax=unclassified Xanthomonas TaxID=2643310 RepID=UPI0013693413|nr:MULTISPECIES: hypothetical protein [unclassified Xanthomonas]MBB5876034.1 hypothetical protein [Xanthomonas sp. 3498]MBB5943323.1 hypothetical protein [Xanthomonas sp. 3307]MXV07655.1 hypothetical protein [Xanthomonas sp. LMG 9002]